MTVSSGATSGTSAASGGHGLAGSAQAGQAVSGFVPELADCFTPRPHTGPGPLSTLPEGRCLVLTGPPRARDTVPDLSGGTGKTQLAANLARTWLAETPGGMLVWLNAGSRDALLGGYAQAVAAGRAGGWPMTIPADTASADSAELTAGRFLAGLAEATGPWLVVMDGLADLADAEGLWPSGQGGRVLVTARSGVTVPDAMNPVVFTVGPFSSHEALTYLMTRLSADPDQRLGAVDLVEELGCDPLALVQASAAIASAGISCRDYHDLYIKRREQIAGVSGSAPAAMAVTWTLSVECADELAPGGAPQVCLAVAALLGAGGIPESVFAAHAVADFAARSPGGADGPGRVRAALASLRNVGLIDVDGGLVLLQQPLRAAVLAATPDSLRAEAAAAAAAALLESWPDDIEQPALAGRFRACAASLQQAAAGALWTGGAHQVLFRAGRSLDAARVNGPAVSHWRAVAAASERRLGAAHEDAQLAVARLASAALAAGLGVDAVALYLRVLETQARYLGADHPRTVAAQAEYGTALLAVGRPDDAIPVLESVLAAGDRGGGADRADALAVQDSLGAAYQQAGRHKDAIKAVERTLAERERRQGPDHPDTIRTRCRLARAWLDAGHAKDAIKHGRRALEGAERVLGTDSLETVDAVTVLASAHHAARRVRDAITLYERALADRERVQGADHPDTIGVRGNLASAYHSANRMPSALDLYERTRSDCQRVLGVDHPDTIGVRGNLASAYHSANRMPSALDLYERTRSDCQRVLGVDHPDTLAARANLAHAYYAVGRTADARVLLTATLADCERALAPGDPLTVAVRDSLAAMADA
jgi:tetratricopeptide (TPR) repeat protein